MKRKMELCRAILLKMEEAPEASYPQIEFGDEECASDEELSYHVMLLKQSGLIEAIDASGAGELSYIPKTLTWQGHEFLDDIRDDTVWKKTKEAAGKKFESVSVAVIGELAKQVIRTGLGLP